MTAAVKAGAGQRHPLAAGLLAAVLTSVTVALAAAGPGVSSGPAAPSGADGVVATSRAGAGAGVTPKSPTCPAQTVGPVSVAVSEQAAPLAWPCTGLHTG